MKKNMTLVALMAIVVALTLVFTGCQKEATPEATATKAPEVTEAPTDAPEATDEAVEDTLSGTLYLSGSTSVYPLAIMLGEKFSELHPEVEVDVQGGGSSQGVKDVAAGSVDIGDASRNVKDSELEATPSLVPLQIAIDGVALIVNPANSVSDITPEQASAILKGEIINWSELGGADADINVYTREAASGTRDAVVGLLELEEKDADGNTVVLITDKALEVNGNGIMKTSVAGDPNGFGYMSLGSVDDTVKKLTVNGVEATVENIKNDTYTLKRPFNMITNGEPEGLAKAFLDFVMSDEGQDLVNTEWIDMR